MARKVTTHPLSPYPYTFMGRQLSAVFEILERSTHLYRKPTFGLQTVTSSDNQLYDIREKVVAHKPFCRLLHFERHPLYVERGKNADLSVQKILVVAPYSGHYATLLRDTVAALLKDHDVYITDWENARDVPLSQGPFTLDDYIQYLMDFVRQIGPNVNIVAVCQPSVPVLAMCSILAAHDDPYQPQSMILMGGPIDTRINPTKVNILAKEKSIEWFNRFTIARVPHYYVGALRRVCPGFLMLAGFMSLHLDRHIEANQSLFFHLTQGDEESAEAHRQFYNEYRSVLDLPADYFLESVYLAFQTHALPLGQMCWRGERIDPAAIRKTALMTIEGEKDDISGVGQTQAAHALCPHIPKSHKHHHLQKGVGNYGVFNGRRWRNSIAPEITKFIKRISRLNA
jgi:poly(3-hydroxybutyrate) depolymerase